jgi:hypothetical protein
MRRSSLILTILILLYTTSAWAFGFTPTTAAQLRAVDEMRAAARADSDARSVPWYNTLTLPDGTVLSDPGVYFAEADPGGTLIYRGLSFLWRGSPEDVARTLTDVWHRSLKTDPNVAATMVYDADSRTWGPWVAVIPPSPPPPLAPWWCRFVVSGQFGCP